MEYTRKQPLLGLLSLAVLLTVTGCTTPSQHAPHPEPESGADDAAPTGLAQALHAQHDAWAGTPYRLGGQDRSGIDCSGFVQTTFETVLDQSLPRTTQAQASVGTPVNLGEIETGDLLFFRTGKKTRHVGIYVEKGRFLHASTSQGVTFSRLDAPYWTSAYWMARRP
ncbi:NlpC/P60 family protein [Aquisalimonas sp.]|uniref:C40 family peptidase n=1 Tax=unclassified Aquisalimonas TaxID=2644645 RepID=UPI0025BCD9F9|nr:NlpC/P60 family protein [Aquisalimonas sp.]